MIDGRRLRGTRALAVAVAIVAALGFAVRAAVAQNRPARSLASRINSLLDAPPFNRTLWGVAVVDDAGKLLYGRNERRLFVPASNLKLVVSAAATVLLPPDWTVRTGVYATGPLADSVLHGDLVLYGRGDPTFSRRCYAVDTTLVGACDADPFVRLRPLAESLRARGVRTVAGDIVGDGSYFEPTLIHPAWENFDLAWWYAAPVSSLGFADNSIDFLWRPGPTPGAPAVVTMQPNPGEATLDNRAVTAPAGGVTDIGDRFVRLPGTLEYRVDGTVALDRPPHTESVAYPDPGLYAARALRQVLREAGIAVTGTTRSTTDSLSYRRLRSAPPLAEVTSRPLRDWLFPILNTSQNWFAEMTLKQLGRQFRNEGSWAAGLAVERRFLIDSAGIDSTQFALVDGSGLASSNYMSPLAFVQLLRFMRRHPRYETFAAGLPLAGARGSLRHRFAGTRLAGRVRAKTGSIAGVNTLAGYLTKPDGTTLTFSIVANHHTQSAKTILAAIDSVVAQLGR